MFCKEINPDDRSRGVGWKKLEGALGLPINPLFLYKLLMGL